MGRCAPKLHGGLVEIRTSHGFTSLGLAKCWIFSMCCHCCGHAYQPTMQAANYIIVFHFFTQNADHVAATLVVGRDFKASIGDLWERLRKSTRYSNDSLTFAR